MSSPVTTRGLLYGTVKVQVITNMYSINIEFSGSVLIFIVCILNLVLDTCWLLTDWLKSKSQLYTWQETIANLKENNVTYFQTSKKLFMILRESFNQMHCGSSTQNVKNVIVLASWCDIALSHCILACNLACFVPTIRN